VKSFFTFKPNPLIAHNQELADRNNQLLSALVAMKDAVKTHRDFQGREYIDLGIQVNNAIDRAKSPLKGF
jgi:hypothetical protein